MGKKDWYGESHLFKSNFEDWNDAYFCPMCGGKVKKLFPNALASPFIKKCIECDTKLYTDLSPIPKTESDTRLKVWQEERSEDVNEDYWKVKEGVMK